LTYNSKRDYLSPRKFTAKAHKGLDAEILSSLLCLEKTTERLVSLPFFAFFAFAVSILGGLVINHRVVGQV
jgi:hypothetical protein